MPYPMPRLGQGVRLNAGLPGTGEVCDILPANTTLTDDQVKFYYGLNPDNPDQYEKFATVKRPIKVDRIVIRRDAQPVRYVIVPPQIFDQRICDLIESPECPKCMTLVSAQKWAGGKCPRCGFEYRPELETPVPPAEPKGGDSD